MDFDGSFFEEEVRSDFLVDQKRKKIWAVGLRMLERLDEVCKKHGIRYYIYYGTLLGAVRHQGFIPWDDDVDVVMFRDDYARFQEIAPKEFTEPYFYQNSYTDRIFWPFSKIRDSRTTAIEHYLSDLRDFHHGIFMDIFPLDSVTDDINEEFTVVEEVERLLWHSITDPKRILTGLKEGETYILNTEFLLDLFRMDMGSRFKIFEDFTLSHFGETSKVNYILNGIFPSSYKSAEREWFQETVYLPFENMLLPAPAEYDKILTRLYGDYHKPVQGGSEHENITIDPDIPYKEYFARYF